MMSRYRVMTGSSSMTPSATGSSCWRSRLPEAARRFLRHLRVLALAEEVRYPRSTKNTRRRGWEMLTGVLRASLVIGFTLALSSATLAQDYPNRPIKLIVPTGAGGITDILARMVGKSLSEQFGQPVIIDNRTGAGGTIGTWAGAHA